ncbi:hypothetical protein [Ochrobactrum sp. Marseille-Q0166]|uniref:hypothetical protein n=1 Tax=Ochrobactrum sp. Marseille-Q0166 TaxID=2761105 RepID=UPI001655EF24|nr:hypothetical protein [Ochrobactrum sp. Marseille-Q0166]MBC8719578.1 hypothetical protein [Ochrobactrum sp. Marseille-Q0166]
MIIEALQGGMPTTPGVDLGLQHQARAFTLAQLQKTRALDRQLSARLTTHRMNVAGYEVERAIANDHSKRLMSALAGKFNLISRIQQSMG